MSDRNQISFTSMLKDATPTLEELSIFVMVKHLLEQDDVKKILYQHFTMKKHGHSLSENRLSKITQLCTSITIPEILENKFLSVYHWMWDQYFDFLSYVEGELRLNFFPDKKIFMSHLINSVAWTMTGNINYAVSLQKFFALLHNVEDDDDLVLMFKIASKFCLEDEIRLVWSKLSLKSKQKFLEKYKVCVKNYFESLYHDDRREKYYFLTLYWACLLGGDEKNFVECANQYVKARGLYYDDLFENENLKSKAINIFLLYCIFDFHGVSAGVKYCLKKSNVDVENIIIAYLKKFKTGYRYNFGDAEILQLLLSKMESEERVTKIFNEFCSVFLDLSVRYFPWNKFLAAFNNLSKSNISDEKFFIFMMRLLEGKEKKTIDNFILKNMWNKNLSIEIKKSFVTYISNKQKNYDVGSLWKHVTIDIMEMFLKDEKLLEIFSPYDNEGIFQLIVAQKYDVINYWLDKCLKSENSIISFMENLIVTKSAGIIKNFQRFPMYRVNSFLDWCFKFEDKMDKNKIWKAKDEAIELICPAGLIRGLKNFDELEKFMNCMLRNRDNYEDKMIEIKKEVLVKIFKSIKDNFWKECGLVDSFNKFLCFGNNNIEKLGIMIRAIDFNECENCLNWLKENNWGCIENFLKFSNKYGKDIIKMKEKIILCIFSDEDLILNFNFNSYYKNIKNLLYWNLKTEKEIWEIKNLVVKKYGVEIITECIEKSSRGAFDNLMNFLFDDNKSNDIDKIFFDLKIKLIENSLTDDLVLEKKNNFFIMGSLLNWGIKDDLKKDIWFTKKYFLECFKNIVSAEIIPDLILGKNNFVFLLFKNHSHENDFKEILWSFKEFLLKEIVNMNNHLFLCQIFEKIDDLKEFLNWNGFNEINLINLKELILVKKSSECCLNWIINNKFSTVNNFLSFCISKDSDYKMLNACKGILIEFCKKSKYWEKENFKLLDKFLDLHSVEKNLMEEIINKYSAKSICKALAEGCLEKVKEFFNWAVKDEKNEMSVKLKKKILAQILNVKLIAIYWKRRSDYWDEEKTDLNVGLNELLYGHQNPDKVNMSIIKLEIIESYFVAAFEKLINERKIYQLKNLLKWVFDDENLKDNSFRLNKLKEEIFKKFGKDYCVVMLRGNDCEAALEFLKPFFHSSSDSTKKLLLWEFKKNCIEQILLKEINEDIIDTFDFGKFWNCLNTFLLWGPTASNMKTQISKLKENFKKQYGIDIIKKMFKDINRNYSEFKYFLRWIFGMKNSNSKMDLGEEALFDFKKEILENVINVEFEDILKENAFYNFLDEILGFNVTHLHHINIMKRSVVNVQGLKLCIDLICHNKIEALQRFLEWVRGPLYDDISNFKISVLTVLAKDLTLVFNWESLKCFLEFGYRLETEEGIDECQVLKNNVLESFSIDISYNWIYKKQWDDVREFLNWNLEPLNNEKLNEFKNRLVNKYGTHVGDALNFDDLMEID